MLLSCLIVGQDFRKRFKGGPFWTRLEFIFKVRHGHRAGAFQSVFNRFEIIICIFLGLSVLGDKQWHNSIRKKTEKDCMQYLHAIFACYYLQAFLSSVVLHEPPQDFTDGLVGVVFRSMLVQHQMHLRQ